MIKIFWNLPRVWLIICFVSISWPSLSQHLYQQPKPLVAKDDLEDIIGPLSTHAFDKDIHILWVYGYDEHHIPGAHDYVKVKDLMVDLLKRVPKVTIDEVFLFPNRMQFEKPIWWSCICICHS